MYITLVSIHMPTEVMSLGELDHTARRIARPPTGSRSSLSIISSLIVICRFASVGCSS